MGCPQPPESTSLLSESSGGIVVLLTRRAATQYSVGQEVEVVVVWDLVEYERTDACYRVAPFGQNIF